MCRLVAQRTTSIFVASAASATTAKACARDGTGSPGHGSPGHRVSDFGRVRSGHGSVRQTRYFDPVLSFNMRVYRDRVTPSRQANIRGFGFGSVPVTALLVYLFQLVPVIFTYLRADCPCDVTTFLDLTSLRLLLSRYCFKTLNDRVGSCRVTGQKS